jgi:hypothetical protein
MSPHAILPQLEAELERADARLARPCPRRRAAAARRHPLRLALATIALFAVIVGGAAALRVSPFGAPAAPPNPHVATHSQVLAGLNVPDPSGGAPWDVELFRNDQGLVCEQVGRVLDGRLGNLGADGLLHPLPPGGQTYSCGGVAGTPFGDTLAVGGVATVTAVGAQPLSCRVNGAPHRNRCNRRDARTLVWGILGRHARALMYEGHAVPLGRFGAYLLVVAGPDHPTGTLRVTWDDGSTYSGSADPDSRHHFFLPKPPKGRGA